MLPELSALVLLPIALPFVASNVLENLKLVPASARAGVDLSPTNTNNVARINLGLVLVR